MLPERECGEFYLTGPGLSLRGGPGPIERGKKMGKGRPTGIKRQDFTHAGPGVTYITFEGEQVPVLNYEPNSYPEILELGHGGRDLRLYGYFDGDEFMEVDREVIW